MKIKKILISALMFGIITITTTCITDVKVKAAVPNETITNNKGQKAEAYTSVDAADTGAMKSSISTSFIEDPNNSNLTALITVKGFIPSTMIQNGSYYQAGMFWPSKYNIDIKITDNNDKIKIIDTIPNNSIDSVKVSETMGYSVGGNVSVGTGEKSPSASIGLTGEYKVERTVEYEQPDFKTFQRKDGIKNAEWDIVFNETRDQYNRDSYHGIYGNQLFMKSRLYNTGDKNLTDEKDLSSLITGGFSPNVVVALKAPRGTKTSKFVVNFNRYMDLYKLKWNTTQWCGENLKNTVKDSTTHTYELDWQNHEVKFLY